MMDPMRVAAGSCGGACAPEKKALQSALTSCYSSFNPLQTTLDDAWAPFGQTIANG